MNQIALNPYKLARLSGTIAIVLVLASIGGQLTIHLTDYAQECKLVKLLSVDAERNIPTCFSMLLMVISALLLAIISIIERSQADYPVRHWAILSCGFLIMAVDEAWSFHEGLSSPVRELLGNENLGAFYFAWVIPGIALVLVLALFFWRFLLHLPAKTRLTFLIAATVYLGGAIGMELIGGSFAEAHGMQNLPYIMIVTLEESLEMAGVIIFIRALLIYIADNYNEVRLRFEAVNEKTRIDGE